MTMKSSEMRSEARAMAKELLKHHKQVCRGLETDSKELTDSQVHDRCIRYGVLCDRIGAPYLTRSAGSFLHDVAEWCESEGWPPINALVVNESGLPGPGYDRAPGGGFANWPTQVRKAILFPSYPDHLSE